MEAVEAVLRGALEGVEIETPRAGVISLRMPGCSEVATFSLEAAGSPLIEYIDSGNSWTLASKRAQRESFVTPAGAVFLVAPGMWVDIRPARGGRHADTTRNPFSPRGRGLCLMLLASDRSWSIKDVAYHGGVSESFASRFLRALVDLQGVEQDDSQFRPRREYLFTLLADRWPRLPRYVEGRVPSVGEAVVGGAPARSALGIELPGLPRIYASDEKQLRMLLAVTASHSTVRQHASWEAIVQPVRIENGLAPKVLVALELAGDPRGRETIRERGLLEWEYRA